MRILFIGDIVGGPGRACVRDWLPELVASHRIDFVAANGENAAGGLGATPAILQELLGYGIHAVTMGNHTWRKKELAPAINSLGSVIRPANYPQGVPGAGSAVVRLPNGLAVGIVSLLTGSLPEFDPQRLQNSTTLLYNDLLRQGLTGVIWTLPLCGEDIKHNVFANRC